MKKKHSLIYLIILISTIVGCQIGKPPKYTAALTIQNGAEFDWHLSKISAFDAWKITNGSSDVVIAVIDSGICFNHSEITHSEWINTDEIAGNAIDDDSNGYVDDVAGWDFVSIGETPDNEPEGEPGDQVHWHATFIAGLISAAIDGDGIAGLASNVSLMNLRVLKADNYAGCTYEELGDSIRYAVDNGADVISMSLQNYPNIIDYYDDIQYAYNNNVSLVSCTGNTWLPGGGAYYQSYPGGYDEVISVGATNYYDAKADYSNYGPWTEIVAPVGDQGYDLLEHLIHSTHNDGVGYIYGIGTSFACPQVSATIALMKSANSTVTSSEIREILQKTATDLGAAGKDDLYGYGMLNVTAAVMEAVNRGSIIQEPEPTPTPTNTSTNGTPGFTSLVAVLGVSTFTVAIMVISRKRK
jgi:subtilisin family serine protease